MKSLNLTEVGTKAKRLLSGSILDETVFCKNCLKFYISAATQLQMKLPFVSKVILYVQYLQKALNECGIYHDSTECSNFHQIDHYWTCIGNILDSD